MRTAVVVGSGAGGATVARALQGAFDVTVLEGHWSGRSTTGSGCGPVPWS